VCDLSAKKDYSCLSWMTRTDEPDVTVIHLWLTQDHADLTVNFKRCEAQMSGYIYSSVLNLQFSVFKAGSNHDELL